MKCLASPLTYPIRAPPASPRISMPPKLGLPHSPIRRAVFHKCDSHPRTAQARGVGSPRARRECIASVVASPLHRDELSLASASNTQFV